MAQNNWIVFLSNSVKEDKLLILTSRNVVDNTSLADTVTKLYQGDWWALKSKKKGYSNQVKVHLLYVSQ